jgi:hypothetical protein
MNGGLRPEHLVSLPQNHTQGIDRTIAMALAAAQDFRYKRPQ